MKKYVAILASALAFAGCAVSEINDANEPSAEKVVFTAGFEQDADAVKTFIDSDLKMRWTAGDRISIFAGSHYNQEFVFEGETGDTGGIFSKVASGLFSVGSEYPSIYAVYPYDSSTSIGEGGELNINLPAVQAYAENSFGVNANTMVAQIPNTSDRTLFFKNVCGFVRVSFYGDAVIKKVTLTANKGEKIAGPATVTSYCDDAPTVVMGEDAGSSIVIDCGKGVRTGENPRKATHFFFAVPPTDFEEGFTIKAEAFGKAAVERSTGRAMKVERNTIIHMSPLEVKGTGTIGIEFPAFAAIPYICEGRTLSTTWKDFSWGVLEAEMHMTYDEFLERYECQPGTFMLAAENKEDITSYVTVSPENRYGALTYVQDDRKVSSVNDVFTWSIDFEQATAIQALPGRTVTLYKQFKDRNSGDIVFIGLTATVADAAKVDFGANKIANEWYDDVNGENRNTAHVNVLVPVSDRTYPVVGGDVTEFYRDLNHYFTGYKPAVALAESSKAVYGDLVKPEDLSCEYVFSKVQPTIAGIAFEAVDAADGEGTAIVNKANHKDTIATLTPAGVITYKWEEGNTTAKKLLNLWGHSAEETAKGILYCNVDVNTYYGECGIPSESYGFHVRFIRPVDVTFRNQGISKDGVVDGANVKVSRFFSAITDWNLVPVIDDNDGVLSAHVYKTIDMYAYYQFKNLTVKLSEAAIDHWDMQDESKRGLLSEIKPDAQLAVGTVTSDDRFIEDSRTDRTIGIADIAEIDKWVLNYRNDRARVTEFNIFVPIEIEYSWGVYRSEFVIEVAKTN